MATINLPKRLVGGCAGAWLGLGFLKILLLPLFPGSRAANPTGVTRRSDLNDSLSFGKHFNFVGVYGSLQFLGFGSQ